jgi:hypothetical protein
MADYLHGTKSKLISVTLMVLISVEATSGIRVVDHDKTLALTILLNVAK